MKESKASYRGGSNGALGGAKQQDLERGFMKVEPDEPEVAAVGTFPFVLSRGAFFGCESLNSESGIDREPGEKEWGDLPEINI